MGSKTYELAYFKDIDTNFNKKLYKLFFISKIQELMIKEIDFNRMDLPEIKL